MSPTSCQTAPPRDCNYNAAAGLQASSAGTRRHRPESRKCEQQGRSAAKRRPRVLHSRAAGTALAQRLQLLGHFGAHEELRIGRRRVARFLLALRDARLGARECAFEGAALGKALLEECIAEKRRGRARTAAER